MRRLALSLVLAAAGGCNSQKAIHITPSLSVAPTSLDFHVVTVGQSAALPVALSSETTTAVQIQGLALSGSGAAAFTLSPNPGTVAGQATVTVTFAPTLATTSTATLTVTSNDPDHPSIAVGLAGVGATEQVEVRLEAVDGGVGSVSNDGGLSIDFGLDTWGTVAPTWPNILLENVGGAAAKLTGFHFAPDAGAFFFPEPPVVPQTIAAEQTRVLPIGFQVPANSSATAFAGSVTLTFDDPATPSVTIQLTGSGAAVSPPSVCAGIVSTELVDGNIETPTAFGSVVPIEPGAQVQLSAYADDLADAGPHPCTSDSSFGRASLLYTWTVTDAPTGSTATPTMPSSPRTDFKPDLVGHYVLGLAVSDPDGQAGVPASPGANQVAFDAAPLEDLTVIAAWPGFPGVDLDLHFLRPGSTPFNPVGDVCALNAAVTHSWSSTGDPAGDPYFSGDDQGSGDLQERASLNHPGESCLPDGGCTFGLWVHYYQDNRSLTGSATCTLPGCVEGQACGCPSDQACEPNPGGMGACGTEVAPEAQVYFKGQIAPALQVPIPLEALLLPSPCFMWHAADVLWVADGGLALAVSDGGLESYWGDHADETRQCAENDGGWAARSPPTYP